MLAAGIAATVDACASPAPPAPSVPTGRIAVTLVVAPPDNVLFEPVHRARATSLDGSVDAAWRIQPGAPPTEIPAGQYRFEAFTVLLSDYIVCADANGVIGEPGSTGAPGATCLQPTMGPSQVCAIDLDVPPGGDVGVVYRELGQGRCELAVASASPT